MTRSTGPSGAHRVSEASDSHSVEALTVALAAELARDGRLAEADDLLQALGDTPAPVACDLLARLHAQQGDLDGAESYWRMIPEDDGLAADAAAGLRRIAILRRRPRWLRFNLWFGGLALLACAVFAILAVLAVASVGSDPGRQSPTGTQPVISSSSPASHSSASSTPNAAPSAPTAASESISPELPAMDVHSRSAIVTRSGSAWVITFKHGLFAAGSATLLQRGRKTLAAVAEGLRSAAGPIGVLVIGHTDRLAPTGRGQYRDNASLGFARAAAVADFLRQESELPLSAFRAASAGSSDPIASNRSAAGRERNRTVVVEVRSQ